MAGPQNAIIGDEFGLDIPETEVDTRAMTEEQKVAKYSKSHEYKKLVAHWDSTIERYQTHLPDGRPIGAVTDLEELGRMWLVANQMIAEIKNVKNYYETAKEVVEQNGNAL